MKKILFVIDSLNSGGAEKSLLSLLTLFDYEKYQVDILMLSVEGLYLPLLPEQVNIVDVPDYIKKQKKGIKHLIINKQFKQLSSRLRTSLSLRNPIKNRKMHSAQIIWKNLSKRIDIVNNEYDCAIAYSQGVPTYFVAEKVIAKKKYCWVNTDYKVASYNKKFDKRYYDQFDKVIAVSDYNREVFIKEMPSAGRKTLVIYDIISPTIIKSLALEESSFKDNYNGLRILTIGRLVDVKGYDLAIEACKRLKEEGYKFKWYVLGEGEKKATYENMVRKYGLQDTFIFLGVHHNPYPYIRNCDIYVQPSRYEGYGLAIAEAKILEKPVVATNFTVVYNQLKENENGVIVNMNPNSIYEGIKKIIEDKDLRNKIYNNLRSEKKGTEEELLKVYSLLEAI
ncbi:glycosyltransferase [Bacillus sp. 1NLA3E]|uniref:glycosyltransferase n=1 Tax=Bacillus sp. 1NLA3E TaxID=666686 RepID=UPI000247E8AB|nr:glycosyltransferase [Bacillus sp. 1NLA3E]AGK52661.1 group 1 glycosyl transferase [Bacillus sp. 1NLA3E]